LPCLSSQSHPLYLFPSASVPPTLVCPPLCFFPSICFPLPLLSVSSSLSVVLCLFPSAFSMSLFLITLPLSLRRCFFPSVSSSPSLLSVSSSLSVPLCLFHLALLYSFFMSLPCVSLSPSPSSPPPSSLSPLLHVPLCLFPYICSPLSLSLYLFPSVSFSVVDPN
jgi:hypothetical protein